MNKNITKVVTANDLPISTPDAILNALSDAVIGIKEDFEIFYANGAAEQFFRASLCYLIKTSLKNFFPDDSPIFYLINQTNKYQRTVFEHDLTLENPKIGSHCVNIHLSPIIESPGSIVLTFQSRSIADKMELQLRHQGRARLDHDLSESDKELTTLIRNETDRICKLVDKIGMFAESGSIVKKPVNIHQVLDRVQKISKAGFAKTIQISTSFDPSLPPVLGNRDQLIQVFLNLVKNAAEEVPKIGGKITLKTKYQQGIKFALHGHLSKNQLPLAISITDNGSGIKEELRTYLFEPFITTKRNGSGLGLALVAKIVNEHGGVVEFENHPNQTTFTVLLPTILKSREA